MNNAKYTPWTIPQREWSKLPDIEITPEIEQKLVAALTDFDDTDLKKRLKKFDVRIGSETMNSIVY